MLQQTYLIISMERAETKGSGSPMWRCVTKDGEKVNVFQHADPKRDTANLFKSAGYEPEMCAMTVRSVITWQRWPIVVKMAKQGDWWTVTDVEARPTQAAPDAVYVPDLAWYKVRARDHARRLLADPRAVFFDTETTGTGPDAEIISLAMLDRDGHTIGKTLIKPCNMEAVERTTFVHQLTPSDLANAPTFPAVMDRLAPRIDGELWIAYNVNFDARMMDQSCEINHLLPLWPKGLHDSMTLFAEYAGRWDRNTQAWQWAKLSEACEALLLPVEKAHDAYADATNMLTLIHRIAD